MWENTSHTSEILNEYNLYEEPTTRHIICVLVVFAKASFTISHIYGLGLEQTLARNSSQLASDKRMKKVCLFYVLIIFLLIKHVLIHLLIDWFLFCYIIIILLIAYVLAYYVHVMAIKLIWIWKKVDLP